MHCAVDLDSTSNLSLASIDRALDRAARRGEVVELYAHHPGATVPVSVIEHVLAGAADRGLAFVTYADFAQSAGLGPGLALSFDDTSVGAWHDQLPLLARFGARVTFFISRYDAMTDDEHLLVRDLATAGHDIEPHTLHHLNAPQYVENHGLSAYLADEVWPSADLLEADGYAIHAFAYPFGARTDELDRAIEKRLPILRSVEFAYAGAVSPCPD